MGFSVADFLKSGAEQTIGSKQGHVNVVAMEMGMQTVFYLDKLLGCGMPRIPALC